MPHKPPRIFDRLLQWYCIQTDLEDIQGDFYEVYYERAEESKMKARMLFALDTLKLFNPFSKQRKRATWLSESYNFNFKNQVRRYFRNLRNYPFINALKLGGLGVAVSAFFYISDYTRFHNTFDQFHDKKERIYRIITTVTSPDLEDVTAWSHYYIKSLEDEFPSVETIVRLLKTEQAQIVSVNDKHYKESEIFYTDPDFSKVFSYEWIEGDPESAFMHKASVVLTRSMATKYFKTDKEVVNRLLVINDESYLITGVIEDVAANSDLKFDILMPFPYEQFEDWMFVYVLLNEDASVTDLEEEFARVIVDYNDDFTEEGVTLSYSFENIQDIHYSEPKLYDTPKMDKTRIILFQLVAWIILIIAIVNYINLYSTELLKRVRGVNVQMVVGASRRQLFIEFISEAVLYFGLSLIFALTVTYFSKEIISHYARFSFFEIQLPTSAYINFSIILIVLVLFTSLHALIMTTSRKNNQLFENKTIKASFRKGLIGLQFALSFGVILSTLIIYRQTSLIQNQPLGFNAEHSIHLEMPTTMDVRDIRTFVEELKSLEFIESVSTMEPNSVPGMTPWVENYRVDHSENTKLFEELGVDESYIETLKLDLVAGEFFKKRQHNYNRTFVVNQAFVKHMGWDDQEAIDKRLQVYDLSGPIVGVVGNFYFNSPHDLIQPMIIRYFPFGRSLIVRVNAKANVRNTILKIDELWKQHIPQIAFNFSFLDSEYKKQFEEEHATLDVLAIVAGLIVLLSVLGMYAILLMLVKAREKELGIRKVNGATQNDLFKLFSIDFIKILIVGIGVTVPIFWFGISNWLDKYPLRISLSPLYFISTAILILLIACFVIFIQASKAYQSNTVEALKYE